MPTHKKQPKKQRISIYVEKDIVNAIRSAAKEESRKLASMAAVLVKRGLMIDTGAEL